jgi:serine/threonine protein kinase
MSEDRPAPSLAAARHPSAIILGRYALGPLLGAGAFGAVHKGRSLIGDKPVAIKLQHLDHAEHRARFEREAQSLARIMHPDVVRVLDFGYLEDGSAALVMEYIDGVPLDRYAAQRGGSLPWREALRLMISVLDGLDAAHEAQVIHRDVKPQNILITQAPSPAAKIIDFGVARPIDAQQRPLTGKGQVLGSLGYMAPEQLLGAPVDLRTDIYAAGCVLFELLCGRPPFDGAGMKLVSAKLQSEGPSEIPRAQPSHDWPASLEALVLTSLRRSPEARPASAFDVSTALQAILRGARTAK